MKKIHFGYMIHFWHLQTSMPFTLQLLAAEELSLSRQSCGLTSGGWQAADRQYLSAPYLSPYHAEPIKLNILPSFSIVVMHGIAGAGVK